MIILKRPATYIIKLSMLVLLSIFYKQAEAQSRNVVKLNALSIGVLTFSGLYEHALTKHWSLQLGYTYTPYLYVPWTGLTFRGHSLTPELRYYTGKQTQFLEGFYVGAFFKYRHNPLHYYNEFGTRESARGIRNGYGAGTLIGYQLLLESKRISIDFFGGPHLNRHYIAKEARWAFESLGLFNRVGVRLGATVGYSF